jgi:NifB/MoaA-like Fe-S oxidoreductase
MLRRGEEVFLDDLTMTDIEHKLNVKMQACQQDGSDLVERILDKL